MPKLTGIPHPEWDGWGKCIFLLPFHAFFFWVRDVVQCTHVIICLKSLMFKWSKALQSIHCLQNYALTVSIKRKLFALWNFAWISNSASLAEYSSKKLLYLKSVIRFQLVTVICHVISCHTNIGYSVQSAIRKVSYHLVSGLSNTQFRHSATQEFFSDFQMIFSGTSWWSGSLVFQIIALITLVLCHAWAIDSFLKKWI